MLKKAAIFIALAIVLTLFGGILYAVVQPKEFQWYPSYSNYGKQPYDTYIFYEQLRNFFPRKPVKKMPEEALVDYYRDEMYDSDTVINDEYDLIVDSTAYYTELGDEYGKFNFIAVEQYFYADNLESKALLLHLYQGNHALIAAEEMSPLLLKMLGVEIEVMDLEEESSQKLKSRFTFSYKDDAPIAYKEFETFSRINSFPDDAQVLAKNELGDIIGVKVPVGKGSLTIFSTPILFTNYYLLKIDRSLVANLLTELPAARTYWGNSLEGARVYTESRTIMDYIHSQKSLSWAFYTLITVALVYLILQMRRVERPIPLIEKPENISLSFIESVSALFFLHKDNQELVRKKMNYFLDRVRTQYHLDTQVIDEQFISRLAKKLQVKPALLTHIFNLYNEFIDKPVVTNDEFIRFNKLMQTFKLKA